MREIKPGWIAAAILAVIAVLILLVKASEKASPAPVAVWVAIQPEGESVARVGSVELKAGTPFRLHAVMEAETLRGGRVFYTEAQALEFKGEPVSTELLRPWGRRLEARILWFKVEGSMPYREVSSGALETPLFYETFQPDWGQAWSVAGDIRPAVENFLPEEGQTHREARFGTQRFHVRIELFGSGSSLVPELRLKSWGAEEVLEHVDEFPGVVAIAPGVLEVPSRVFGLSQIEFVDGKHGAADMSRLSVWTDQRVAFSRILVLGKWLAGQGAAFEDLAWQDVELGVSGAEARPGDLLRAGTRLVWVLEDRGESGLDYEDWCLDFQRGARVQRLGDVFVGEGLVGWARAPAASETEPRRGS